MTLLLSSISTLAAGLLSGAIVFQAFVVAPTVFDSLDVYPARRFLRSVFPRFYRLGFLSGSCLLASSFALGALHAWPAGSRWLVGLAVTIVLAVVLSLWLVPRINAARDAGISGQARFRFLHRLSVLLTLLTLALAVIAVVLLSGDPTLAAS